MKEFEPFEIERSGQPDEDIKTGLCPILRQACIGERCMWWVRDWSDDRRKFHYNCAVSMIAIGINDEALHRIAPEEE